MKNITIAIVAIVAAAVGYFGGTSMNKEKLQLLLLQLRRLKQLLLKQRSMQSKQKDSCSAA
jgi:type II secretory pathway pseudopilin PulG